MDRVDSLPSKFNESIINRDDFGDKDLKNSVEALFQKIENEGLKGTPLGNKDYVRKYDELPGYIIKSKRTDLASMVVAPDTHIYRVRKARKIQGLIDKYKLSNDIVVPKKFLYFSGGQWFVIAEELKLSDKFPSLWQPYWSVNGENEKKAGIAQGMPAEMIQRIDEGSKPSSDQCQAITPGQARAKAILSFEARVTDWTLANIYFTEDGKSAVLDTEPVKRYLCKSSFSVFGTLFRDRYLFNCTQGMLGTAKLKLQLSDRNARNAVIKVENYYLSMGLLRTAVVWTGSIVAFKWIGNRPWSRWIKYPLKSVIILKLAVMSNQAIGLSGTAALGRTESGQGLVPLVVAEAIRCI